MTAVPTYLDPVQATQAAILARLIASFQGYAASNGLNADASPGGFVYDVLAAYAAELALAAAAASDIETAAFVSTAVGARLDDRALEHGVTRKAAIAAIGTVAFTGANGTVVPAGTRVTTAATTAAPAVAVATTADATISGGTATAAAAAVVAGAAGNVAAGSLVLLGAPVTGITAVTNAGAFAGGADAESDEALRARVLFAMQNPATGGNASQYAQWATAVVGVGAVSVVPVRDGAGTVSVAVVDLAKAPATQALVDVVQAAIAPIWLRLWLATVLTISGTGISSDATHPGVDGAINTTVKKQVYDAAGNTLYVPNTQLVMPTTKPGVYRWRMRAKIDSAVGAVAMYRLGVWNTTVGNWCATSSGGAPGAAVTDRTAAQMPAAYGATTTAWLTQLFYWNGTDSIEARGGRLGADASRVVWVDEVQIDSTFSQDTGIGLAPIGHRVTVEPATSVTITATATLTIGAGYDTVAVKAAVTVAVNAYLTSIAFNPPGSTVYYARVGAAILNVPGVVSYASLLVNGAGNDVAVGAQAVPVAGAHVWS